MTDSISRRVCTLALTTTASPSMRYGRNGSELRSSMAMSFGLADYLLHPRTAFSSSQPLPDGFIAGEMSRKVTK